MKKTLLISMICVACMAGGCSNQKNAADSTTVTETVTENVASDSNAKEQSWNEITEIYQKLADAYNEIAGLYNREMYADEEVEQMLDQAVMLLEVAGNFSPDRLSTDDSSKLIADMTDLIIKLRSEKTLDRIMNLQSDISHPEIPFVTEEQWVAFDSARQELSKILSENTDEMDPVLVSGATEYLAQAMDIQKEYIDDANLEHMTAQLNSYMEGLR